MQPKLKGTTNILITSLAVTSVMFFAPAILADPLTCGLGHYKASPGLTAVGANNALTITWDGDRDEEIKLQMTINDGTPTIQDLALRRKGAQWVTLMSNVTPDFRVVSGLRREDNESLEPLEKLGPITPDVLEHYRWVAFWDAPLMIPGTEKAGYQGSQPPAKGIADQPGLPRMPEEVHRDSAVYHAESCTVKTNGARLEVTFPGVKLGVFSGRLQYTVYKGTNLIRQEIVAATDQPAVAYKYAAGLKGLAIDPASRIVWRDTSNNWQSYQFGGPIADEPVPLIANNRVAAAEVRGGSVATFPPPHNFFWSREIAVNLGYDWYQNDSAKSYSFGVREADSEAEPVYAGRGPTDYRENFALRNARPGTWQRMPVYFYVSLEPGQGAIQSALAFTRSDHYKPLPGDHVMATHFHAGIAKRLLESGSLNTMLPDFEAVKAAGINIYAPIDGDGANGIGVALPGAGHLKNLDLYYKAARLNSDKDFVMMPNEEIMSGEDRKLAQTLGGHTDLFISHPVYWIPSRDPEQQLVTDDPTYGKVYHIGSREDLLEMSHREDLIIFMPHPGSKGSAGYPQAIKDTNYFRDPNWRGTGFRWGMGLDGSEQRLCDYRCQPIWDDMNNWIADLPTPPKYIQAISELNQVGPGDDIYANDPVNYVKLDKLPSPGDWKPIVDAMKRGEYFVTSGEVLIPHYKVEGTGTKRTIVADVEWTFPLEFAEVVWGDGTKTDRQIISATDLPAFGKHHYEIPFDATGKKWVRFAVWDSAGNGAMVQPIKLTMTANPAP